MPNKLILDSHWERSGDHVTVERIFYLAIAGWLQKMPIPRTDFLRSGKYEL